MSSTLSKRTLFKLIERCLREDPAIDIDGFGSFQLDDRNHVVFEPSERIRVFLAYADEDRAQVKKLYTELQKAGFEPWMDQEKLVPGQNWPRAIDRAIELSDFFLGCFSKRSAVKRGHFQCELRYALDLAARVPLEDIFLVPLAAGRLRRAASDCNQDPVRGSVSRLAVRGREIDEYDAAANDPAPSRFEAGPLALGQPLLGLFGQFGIRGDLQDALDRRL